MAVLLFGERVDKKYLELQRGLDEKRMINSSEVRSALEKAVVGQPQAIDALMPFIQMYSAGFNPEDKPVGSLMLLGPTGTGKTLLCESLADVLHGSRKKMIKVNCGEYHSSHEVARILGSPPGYQDSEIKSIFSQFNLNAATSNDCSLQIILLDEIEKAADSFQRLMLGVLDKASLGLSNNTTVSFANALIFMTSNLGSDAIRKANTGTFGLERFTNKSAASRDKLHNIGMDAARKRFLPEFINRIDASVTYASLDLEAYRLILNHLVADFGEMTKSRLGYLRNFGLIATNQAAEEIIRQGTSVDYGARELKRVFQRIVVIPLAVMVENGDIPPQSTVVLDYNGSSFDIIVKP